MTEKERPQLDLFLAELGELSKKYGLIIDGCGCCCSPTVIARYPEYEPSNYSTLKWYEWTQIYTHD